MQTLTTRTSKVHHIPARLEQHEESTRDGVTFLCNRGTFNGVRHEDATATCVQCVRELARAETLARRENERRRQQVENEAAYERMAQREAEEKAAREAARVTPAVHVVELKALPNYGADNWTSDVAREDHGRTVYRMHSRYGRGSMRFTIFYVGPDGEARRTYRGPVLAGPYCALVPMSSVISAWQGEPEDVVEVQEGDVLLLNGVPMILIDDQAAEYPHAVTPAEYGARLAAREIGKLYSESRLETKDAAFREAEAAVRSLYRDGHTVLPFAFEPPAILAAEPEPEPEAAPEYRDSYVSYAGHAYRVVGSAGDARRYGLWVVSAETEDQEALFVRMTPEGCGDLVAQCLHAWGMARTLTGEAIQWDDQQGHYLDRAGNVRTDIQFN